MTGLQPDTARTVNNEGFWSHLQAVFAHVSAVSAKLTDMVIYNKHGRVVVRVSYVMTADGQKQGEEEAVENDVVWLLGLTDDGEKVKQSVEFFDGEASVRIMEVIGAIAAGK